MEKINRKSKGSQTLGDLNLIKAKRLLNEDERGLERALISQNNCLMIAYAGDMDLDSLIIGNQREFKIKVDKSPEKTYGELFKMAKFKKMEKSNLALIKEGGNGFLEGKFYSILTNLYDSRNFTNSKTAVNSFYNPGKGYILLNMLNR